MSDALNTTLADIKAAELAEQQAAHDAYLSLVQDMAGESLTATPGQVVAVLRRAGRTTEELAGDVQRAKRTAELESLVSRLPEHQRAETDLKAELALANEEHNRVVNAAAAVLGEIGGRYEACRDRIHECVRGRGELNALRMKQQQIDLKRGHTGKKASAEDTDELLLVEVMD